MQRRPVSKAESLRRGQTRTGRRNEFLKTKCRRSEKRQARTHNTRTHFHKFWKDEDLVGLLLQVAMPLEPKQRCGVENEQIALAHVAWNHKNPHDGKRNAQYLFETLAESRRSWIVWVAKLARLDGRRQVVGHVGCDSSAAVTARVKAVCKWAVCRPAKFAETENRRNRIRGVSFVRPRVFQDSKIACFSQKFPYFSPSFKLSRAASRQPCLSRLTRRLLIGFILSPSASMVSLKLQKRLAASVLKCGQRKIWLDPNESNEISVANSRTSCQAFSRAWWVSCMFFLAL